MLNFTEMQLELCDYELSVLLKEAGCNLKVDKYFKKDHNGINHRTSCNHIDCNNYPDTESVYYSRPTLEHAAMWLREAKGYLISITWFNGQYLSSAYKNVNSMEFKFIASALKNQYNEALISGIKAALLTLKETK
jgi:hypothetical protein